MYLCFYKHVIQDAHIYLVKKLGQLMVIKIKWLARW